MNPRLQELREKFEEKRTEFSIHDLVEMESGEMEIPAWKRILDNVHTMKRSRDDTCFPCPNQMKLYHFWVQ